MKKEQCKKDPRGALRNIVLTVRVTKKQSQWMAEEYLSPTAIMQEALKELGCNDE